MTPKLSTHVLDTAHGKPAAGMSIELWKCEPRTLVKSTRTNSDGRTDEPWLGPGAFAVGEYELIFDVGGYFGDATFLSKVPVRFTLNDPRGSYHVPLLCTPWSYSTYRGS